jgi:hypothetical protein
LELAVNEKQACDLCHGKAVFWPDPLKEDTIYRAVLADELIAFVKVKGKMVLPFKVFKQM